MQAGPRHRPQRQHARVRRGASTRRWSSSARSSIASTARPPSCRCSRGRREVTSNLTRRALSPPSSTASWSTATSSAPRRGLNGVSETRERDLVSEDTKSWGYPSFAKDFPANDELHAPRRRLRARRLRDRRTDAPKLAASTDDDDAVKKAAQTSASASARSDVAALFVFAFLLLAFLTFWWVTHDGPDGNAAPAEARASAEGGAHPLTPAHRRSGAARATDVREANHLVAEVHRSLVALARDEDDVVRAASVIAVVIAFSRSRSSGGRDDRRGPRRSRARCPSDLRRGVVRGDQDHVGGAPPRPSASRFARDRDDRPRQRPRRASRRSSSARARSPPCGRARQGVRVVDDHPRALVDHLEAAGRRRRTRGRRPPADRRPLPPRRAAPRARSPRRPRRWRAREAPSAATVGRLCI